MALPPCAGDPVTKNGATGSAGSRQGRPRVVLWTEVLLQPQGLTPAAPALRPPPAEAQRADHREPRFSASGPWWPWQCECVSAHGSARDGVWPEVHASSQALAHKTAASEGGGGGTPEPELLTRRPSPGGGGGPRLSHDGGPLPPRTRGGRAFRTARTHESRAFPYATLSHKVHIFESVS